MERGVASGREIAAIQAGEGVELQPMSLLHAERLYALIDRNRARLRQWLPWVQTSFNLDDLVAFINGREQDNAERISLTTVIFVDGRMCGSVGLHAIEKRDRHTSIGYWIDRGFEGRGIMTRACRAIVDAGFRDYGLHRIVIECASGNARSSAIAQRLGFVEEGILREAEWLYDHWVDLRVFSMLQQDWNRAA